MADKKIKLGTEVWLYGNAFRIKAAITETMRVYPGTEKTEIRRLVLERAFDIEEGNNYAD